jgi:hypothetical protein
MKDGHAKLKTEVEKTYPCLGIACEEVGVYQSAGVNKGGMGICVPTVLPTDAPATSTDQSGAVVAAFAMVLLNVYT